MVEYMNDNLRHRKLTPTPIRAHRFGVGVMVTYRTSSGGEPTNFRVERQLPDGGQGLQYRIRSERDGHERVALESNLEEL
jgi:hypothetical protein